MGVFFYLLCSFFVNLLPLKVSFWMAGRIGDIYCFFAGYSRKVVKSNLEHLFKGEKSKKEIKRLIRQTFREFGKYLVWFFYSPSLTKNNIDRFISIENLHYIEEALKAGKGAIILTCHFGNWELSGMAMSLKGYPVNAVALNHKSKSVNNFFVNRRENKGLKNIPLGAAVRRCFEVLHKNEILALLGDREFSNSNHMGINVNFCGKETRSSIPTGAAKFALKTGAKIVPGFTIKCSQYQYKLILHKPLDIITIDSQDKDVREIMENFFFSFEKVLKKYPAQWFLFYPLWEKIK